MAEEWTVASLALQNYRVAGCSKPVGLGENIQVPKTSKCRSLLQGAFDHYKVASYYKLCNRS